MEPKNLTMTLSDAEWGVVLNALAGRPYAEVFQVVAKLQQQAATQQIAVHGDELEKGE